MRRAMTLLALCGAMSGCGSLVEHWDAGPTAGDDGGGGLVCLLADKCACEACTDVSQCRAGVPCALAKEHGVTCPDNRSVCTTEQ